MFHIQIEHRRIISGLHLLVETWKSGTAWKMGDFFFFFSLNIF